MQQVCERRVALTWRRAAGSTALYGVALSCVLSLQIWLLTDWYSGLETGTPVPPVPPDSPIRHNTPILRTSTPMTRARDNADFHPPVQDPDMAERRNFSLELDAIYTRRTAQAEGEMGRRVTLHPSNMTQSQIAAMEVGYSLHGFNEYISERISLRRGTPDFRSALCRKAVYPTDLPRTSVIICFHNEAVSTLVRTVYSVLDHTPPHLLHEIILVDDFSSLESLGSHLDDLLSRLPRVRLVRASSRLGLVGARLLGTSSATAPVLTFLDSHVECLQGWLEPMLTRIWENDSRVVFPILPVIDSTDFSISRVSAARYGLFKWMDLSYFATQAPDDVINSRHTEIDPIPSPTMPGGIFSINRRYFQLLGRYDPGLKLWGSENMELSFKVWMCGGSVELLPCSQVAHVFRKVNPNLGVDFYRDITTNAMRVAYVWMDEYKYFLFNNFMQNNTLPDFGPVKERLELRERLGCRNFRWYMDHVATSMYAPVHARSILQIESDHYRGLCLVHAFHRDEVGAGSCSTSLQQQRVWYLDDNGWLLGSVLHGNQSWSCLSVDDHSLTMGACRAGVASQQWTHTHSGSLQNSASRECVTLQEGGTLLMSACTDSSTLVWSLLTLHTSPTS